MAEEFGPYLLEEVIGRGGMGVVYRAYDTRRDRTVALKRLPRELASDEHFQARFRRESRLAARLNEPHIIPIHDFGEYDGQLFIDMRLVEGVDLSRLITDEGGALSVELAVDIIAQVSAALASAHSAGLMHRDIKPSNVLISGMTAEDRTSPFAYLVDFGIARAIGNEGTALTSTTDWFGTVAYMAPERISGSSGDSRSDIYSLACLLYQCLTGQAPFTGEALQVLFAHVNNAPPSASEKARAIPPGLDAAIRRGMAKKPEDRYQTVAQFASAVKSSVRPSATATGTSPFPPGPQPGPQPGASLPPQGRPRHAGPPQSFPPRSGPPAAGGYPAAFAGPPNSNPPRSGPPNSIPPRSGPPAGNNRALSILIAVTIVVVLAAIIAVIIAVNGDGNSDASGSPSSGVARTASSLSDSATDSASTGTTSSWPVDYRHFTKLIGDAPGAKSTAYRNATCKLAAADDGVAGMIDQVSCSGLSSGSKVVFYVGRFNGKASTDTYVDSLVKQKYGKKYWTIDQQRRGLLLTSPSTIKYVDVTSSICALPQFLVQFYAAEGSGVDEAQVESEYWKNSVFPDVDPEVCT